MSDHPRLVGYPLKMPSKVNMTPMKDHHSKNARYNYKTEMAPERDALPLQRPPLTYGNVIES